MTTPYPRWWERYWFADGSPYHLAAARIVVGLLTIWILLSKDLPGVSGEPLVFWSGVPVSRHWRYLLFPGYEALEYVLEAVTVVALIAVVLGVFARSAALVAALLLYHLAPLETIVSGDDPGLEGFGTLILALAVLAFASCDRAWAVRAQSPRAEPWQFRWPLCMLQILVAQVYCFSAVGKLRLAGLDWVSGENIQRWVWLFNQWPNVGAFNAVGPRLVTQPLVPDLIAGTTIAIELAFPLVLISPLARRVLIPLAVVFHVGVVFAMNLFFKNAILLLVFVNWDWLRRGVPRLVVRRRGVLTGSQAPGAS